MGESTPGNTSYVTSPSYCTETDNGDLTGTMCDLPAGHSGDHRRVFDDVTLTWSDPLPYPPSMDEDDDEESEC